MKRILLWGGLAVLCTAALWGRYEDSKDTPSAKSDSRDVPGGVLVADQSFKRSSGGDPQILFLSRPGMFITKLNTQGVYALWKVTDKGLRKIREYDHGGWAVGMSVSLDQKYLVTSGLDKMVRVWDISSGQQVLSVNTGEKLYKADITADGKTLIAGTTGRADQGEGSLILYIDMNTGQISHKQQMPGGDTSYLTLINSDTEFFYCSTVSSKDVYIGKWKSTASPLVLTGLDAGPTLRLTPDGKHILGISHHWKNPARVVLWDIASRKLLSTLSLTRGDDSFMDAAVSADNQLIYALFVRKMPESTYFGYKSYISIYERSTGKKLGSTGDYDLEGGAITISPDGSVLVVAGEQRLDENYGKDQGRLLLLNPAELLQ